MPNSLRFDYDPVKKRVKVTVVSENERDISATVDVDDFDRFYEEALLVGEGALVQGHEDDDS